MEKFYYKYSFTVPTQNRYILLARLQHLGFDGFEETEEGWHAYIPGDQLATDTQEELNTLAQLIPYTYSQEKLPGQNWNAIWEAGFQPITVASFCGVRADFHPPMPKVTHEIIVNPEMAFGTGHHATTYMMLAAMETLSMADKKILDYGCGTGILSILAAKLGSTDITAVDIEEEAYLNTLDNCQKNKSVHVNAIHGTLEAVLESGFDIILANINRNVILDSFPALYDKLTPNGLLLISGILKEDQELVLASAQDTKFHLNQIRERDGWLSILFTKV